MMIKLRLDILAFLLVLGGFAANGQQVEASIDSASIKIGSQFHLTLKTTVKKNVKVNFPEGQDFGKLEVLESYPTDTTQNGSMYELVKKYGLTQFDSGKYTIPPLSVVIDNKKIKTKPLTIEVRDIPVDTLKQKMYDIKPVIVARRSFAAWWWAIGIAAVLAATTYLAWKYRKKEKAVSQKQEREIKISPIEKAHRQLQELERQNLLSKGEVKDYYSRLTDIARTYIEEATNIPAMESTTGEVIDAMHEAVRNKKINLSPQTFEQLEKVLRTADMVKFAKERPADAEIAGDKEIVEQAIATIDKSLPEESERDSLRAHLALEMKLRKKERQKKDLIIIAAAVAVFAGLAFTAMTLGREYLQDNIFGHPTKELLDSEWVKSEYGTPGIVIETPKVLQRRDMNAAVPGEARKLVVGAQLFVYGSMTDNFYIVAGTTSYTQPVQTDPVKLMELDLKELEAKGAENILMKDEEYSTDKGTVGLRAYGTLTVTDLITDKKIRCVYEGLYFVQPYGVQKVIIMHRDDDKYAKEITERIKNSVEIRIIK